MYRTLLSIVVILGGYLYGVPGDISLDNEGFKRLNYLCHAYFGTKEPERSDLVKMLDDDENDPSLKLLAAWALVLMEPYGNERAVFEILNYSEMNPKDQFLGIVGGPELWERMDVQKALGEVLHAWVERGQVLATLDDSMEDRVEDQTVYRLYVDIISELLYVDSLVWSSRLIDLIPRFDGSESIEVMRAQQLSGILREAARQNPQIVEAHLKEIFAMDGLIQTILKDRALPDELRGQKAFVELEQALFPFPESSGFSQNHIDGYFLRMIDHLSKPFPTE